MNSKITASHMERKALVYIRQSTVAQVLHNVESTSRQYGLADRARALGWAPEAIEVIDEDLGKSGSTTQGRSGLLRLAHAVAHGRVGAVLAIEVSRLARSSVDWQQLMRLCAVAGVVVADEQAVYDPASRDDRLLLDLKGTMSEAELAWLGLRLAGARRHKAARGALRMSVPTGYVWRDGLVLDADEAVQSAVRAVFARFDVEPSVWAVVRWAARSGFTFPTRRERAGGASELAWKPLGYSRLCNLLHNPIYAGVYAWGRRPEKDVLVDGEIRRVRSPGQDPDAWSVRIDGAHAGYISWQVFLKNRDKLRENASRMGVKVRGAPREGPASLAGLLVCGRCGGRMTTSYWGLHSRKWSYLCPGERLHGGAICWSTAGPPIDAAVDDLFLQTMVPSELELCLAVEQQVTLQADDLAQQWRLRIEKAQYEARLAERRYKAIDPDNRVVARTLEREWEMKLREIEEISRQYEMARAERRVELTAVDRARIRALASDLPAVWRAPTTTEADRKAMLRLVIEAISLEPIDVPSRETGVRVQWKGGAVTELRVYRPARHEWSRTPAVATERIRELAAQGVRDEDIAERLNAAGIPTGAGKRWVAWAVKWARRRNGIEQTAPDLPRREPVPDQHPDGRYSIRGTARRFGVTEQVVRKLVAAGTVTGRQEDFGPHRHHWWLDVDDEAAAQLEAAAQRSARRRSQKTSNTNP